MLDIGSSELLLIVIVAVVVIGPKDLPRVLYKLGQIIGKGRAMTRHFRAGIDEMVRHAELEELEKKWEAENARIMAQTASQNAASEASPIEATPALPAPHVETTSVETASVVAPETMAAVESSLSDPADPPAHGSAKDEGGLKA